MLVLITYDVSTEGEYGKKRLRYVAKICQNYGQRVQNSVFECLIDPQQLAEVKNKLIKVVDKEKDSLRFYYLGKKWDTKVEHFGAKQSFNLEEPIII